MDFKPVNLAEIYAAADDARMRRAQIDEFGRQQRRQQEQDMRDQSVRDAYVINPEGVLDETATLSNLYKSSPLEAHKFQQGQLQAKQAQQKMDIEDRKAKLEQGKALLTYGRDRLAQVSDQAGYDALRQELSELGATFAQSMAPQFSPDMQQQYLLTADEAIKQATPKYERIDLGGRVQVVDVNPFTNPAIRGTQFDKSATPEAMMSDRRAREEGALNRGVQMRGQDLSAYTSRRGQDLAASTAAARAASPQKSGLSPTAQKELFEADEIAQASQNAIGMLNEALSLNKQAYSGIGAKPRAILRSNLPGSTPEADATINLDNLMTGQALESLKATFGGMPTEGERKILLDIQASADKTPTQREQILKRAVQAAQKRLKFSQSKSQALRTGSYFTEGVPVIESAPTQNQTVDFGSLK